MLFLVDRRERVLWTVLRDDLHVERARGGDARPETGKDNLVDIGDLDEHGLLGDEEDIFLEHEEVTLYGFQIRFEPRVPRSAGRAGYIRLIIGD